MISHCALIQYTKICNVYYIAIKAEEHMDSKIEAVLPWSDFHL